MRRSVLLVAFVGLCLSAAEARAVTLDDVQFWVGQGQNRSGFVVDWNDGKTPLLWGYRWDGTATAHDLFFDLVAADDRLFAKASVFSFGTLINGVGYDRDDDGFAISDGTVFTDGLSVGPPSDGASATDSDDSYLEGFVSGFFGYYFADGNPFLGDDWEEAQVGIGDMVLTDGGFQGIRFRTGFASEPPTLPVAAPGAGSGGGGAAMPEPSAAVMLVCGAVGLCLRRR